MLRYADVHLPPTYIRFPPAAPRYHIHGPNKTYTPPPLPKPNPSICFLASLQDVPFYCCSSIRRRVVSIVPPICLLPTTAARLCSEEANQGCCVVATSLTPIPILLQDCSQAWAYDRIQQDLIFGGYCHSGSVEFFLFLFT
ncbi:hypothetical protein F4820DRAFT_341255 [Hypoxylon rubiginosum]|uniref:Uncharacterized protein n=1 Tax=Hypoxylon rubiginosum TaxID=110542 RepID=A0ACB9ZDU4_9PEZI|nr:hypothetical protein F4820DRAFT_341255 [Hypoxylon rubiginosum]